jgi:hypothetical protein
VTLIRLEIRHQAVSSVEKTCARHNGRTRVPVNSRSPSPVFRTIHLEVMPDSDAELDGITMSGVLSICKAGLFTGGWYVEEDLDYRH